jgi:hypothetical protein
MRRFSPALHALAPRTAQTSLNLSDAPVHQIWAKLGAEMDAAGVIALREHMHLRQDSETPVLTRPLSGSAQTWARARQGIKVVRAELMERLRVFGEKWEQRWTLEGHETLLRILVWHEGSEGAWRLKGRGAPKEARELFRTLAHELAKDLEKELIFAEARCKSLQDLILKEWYASLQDPEDRILPALESSLRPAEQALLRRSRENVYELLADAFVRRAAGVGAKTYGEPAEILTALGALSPMGVPPYLKECLDFAQALCLEWLDVLQTKWGLYLRGCVLPEPRWEP